VDGECHRGGPRGPLSLLQHLLAEDSLPAPVVLALKDGDDLGGERGDGHAVTMLAEDLIATRVRDEVGELQTGEVVRLLLHLELPR